MTWKATKRWKPSKEGYSVPDALAVENARGDLGYAKPAPHIASEKIASDLGRWIGVPVPEVRLEYSEPHRSMAAISIVDDQSSIDLASWLGRGNSIQRLAPAFRAASGLLPYFAWFHMADRSPWNLVVTEREDEGPTVIDVDHDYVAVGLIDSRNLWSPPDKSLDVLLANLDRRIVFATVQRIERLRLRDIRSLVGVVASRISELHLEDYLLDRIRDPARELFRRGKCVRYTMEMAGWVGGDANLRRTLDESHEPRC